MTKVEGKMEFLFFLGIVLACMASQSHLLSLGQWRDVQIKGSLSQLMDE